MTSGPIVARWAFVAAGMALCALANSQEDTGLNDEETPRYWPTFSDELKSGGKGPLMAPIDGGGRFQMGCVSRVRCLFNQPVHEVVIERPFALSVYEITRGDFKRFVDQTGYVTDGERPDVQWPIGKKPIPEAVMVKIAWSKRNCLGWSAEDVRTLIEDPMGEHVRLWNWRNPGFEQRDEHPVVCISWADAAEYVKWLAAETGRPYRLPSEAEWEYAARAGPLSLENYEDTSSWCDRNYREPCINNFILVTRPVGGHGPNAFGLYDIGSGVGEWTEDCWNRDFRGAPADGSAWTAGDCSRRVSRDIGNWRRLPFHELRGPGRIHATSNSVGIRVAASPTY